MKKLTIALTQRAVLVRDNRVTVLGPGRHTLWRDYHVTVFDTDKLVFTAPAAVLAALPSDWYETVELAPGHYGIVTRDARPAAFLRPGVHRLWRLDPGVRVRVVPRPSRCRRSLRSCAR